jgi:hypothetical protein
VKEICVQRNDSKDNVDGVVMVNFERLTLHDCATGKIATDITGNYAGIDANGRQAVQYLGGTSQPK